MKNRLAVGVDVGGTKIAAALVNMRGEVVAHHTVSTSPQDGVRAVLDRIASSIDVVSPVDGSELVGVGIGCPGPVDYSTGTSIFAANMGDQWQNVPLQDEMRKRLKAGVAVFAENDVKAGAIGEMYYGVAQGCGDFIYITVGTGLGGCAVINQKILYGAKFSAMEIGHIVYRPGERLCTCGQHGCVEMYASGKGMMAGYEAYRAIYPETVLNETTDITTPDILQAARATDPLSTRIVAEGVDSLGITLASCVALFNPAMIVIGGGLGHAAWDILIEPAVKVARSRVLPDLFNVLRIEKSQVESSAVGAAALVWHELSLNAK